MVVLNPQDVAFDGIALRDATRVSVDRTPVGAVEEWGDGGPYAVFADVTRRRVTVRVERAVAETGDVAPEIGALGALSFAGSNNASSSGRVTVSVPLAVALAGGYARQVDDTVRIHVQTAAAGLSIWS